ncbi:MAG: RcnB family protein [Rhizomicrobium sp.]|nr:RcnB family protein [Rhizomicrobium sp.]
MKKFVLCAAALSLFAFAPLSAQNDEHRGNNDAEHGKSDHPAAQQERKAPEAQNRQGPAMRSDNRGNGADSHPAMNRAPAAQPQNAQHNFLPGSGDVRQPSHANNDRMQNNAQRPGNAMQVRPPVGNRPALNEFRRNIQAPKQFHSGSYRAPQGYSYRHWSYGETLPRGYYARNYWISDFLLFGLFAPPSDLIWVRVGNDALLIDRDSGDIVQVRYGVFY